MAVPLANGMMTFLFEKKIDAILSRAGMDAAGMEWLSLPQSISVLDALPETSRGGIKENARQSITPAPHLSLFTIYYLCTLGFLGD